MKPQKVWAKYDKKKEKSRGSGQKGSKSGIFCPSVKDSKSGHSSLVYIKTSFRGETAELLKSEDDKEPGRPMRTRCHKQPHGRCHDFLTSSQKQLEF